MGTFATLLEGSKRNGFFFKDHRYVSIAMIYALEYDFNVANYLAL
jgi:hypothetical protein